MSRARPGPLRRVLVAGATGLLAIGVACNEGPARSALAEVEASIAQARADLARYVPEQLAALEAELRVAHARLDEGHYTDALRTAQRLPLRVAVAVATAGARRQSLLAAWSPVAAELASRLAALDVRLRELAAAKTLPRGLDPDRLAAERTAAAELAGRWAAAQQAFSAGDLPLALRAAEDARGRARAIAARLGVETVVVAPPPGAASASALPPPPH